MIPISDKLYELTMRALHAGLPTVERLAAIRGLKIAMITAVDAEFKRLKGKTDEVRPV